jgi:hypothetical protein
LKPSVQWPPFLRRPNRKREETMKEPMVEIRKGKEKQQKTAVDASVLNLLAVVWLVLAVCGCASKNALIASEGNLSVKIIPSHWVRISDINVKQEIDNLLIEGELRRLNAAFSGRGHVDVAVMSGEGILICKASGKYKSAILPKTPGARNHPPSRFQARLHCIPPEGSIIRVAYHNAFGPDDPDMGCGDNAALPDEHDVSD